MIYINHRSWPLVAVGLILSNPTNPVGLDMSFNVKAICLTGEVSWKPVKGAAFYRLGYRPYPGTEPWSYVDLPGDDEKLSVELWDDARFEAQMEAIGAQGESLSLSGAKKVHTGEFLLPPIFNVTKDGLRATVSWNEVPGAEEYLFVYSNNGNIGHALFDRDTRSFSADLWDGAFFGISMSALGDHEDQSRFPAPVSVFTGSHPDFSPETLEILPFENPRQVVPVRQESPYANFLQDCLYSEQRTESCELSRLPLIGQETSNPAVDYIMDRVVTSDEWMAVRFRSVLEALPAETLRLFRPITGIVISGDIRPAFYSQVTGAIYLDPKTLWLDEFEKSAVSPTPDFRTGCGDALNYFLLADYVINGEPLIISNQAQLRPRSQDDVVNLTARTLFHELSHANDVFPPETLTTLPPEVSVLQAAIFNMGSRVSYHSHRQFPLHSETLKYLAGIRYGCNGATCSQVSIGPQQVAAEFALEMTNSDFSFFTEREDVAMIAEEAFMRYFLNAERVVLITENPSSAEFDLTVHWGQRGRIADPILRTKATFILSQIYPEIDFDAYLDNLPEPINILQGAGVRESLYSIAGTRLGRIPPMPNR